MYEDKKFKIIDMKPERDLINYVWTRLLTLAAKVNFEGDLYILKKDAENNKAIGIDNEIK
jgi:hypothetical protein